MKLQDLFEAAKPVQEPERMFQTFAAWKRAIKAEYPEAWLDGDQDIGQMMVGPKPFKRGETVAVGEWDGSEGVMFSKAANAKHLAYVKSAHKLGEANVGGAQYNGYGVLLAGMGFKRQKAAGTYRSEDEPANGTVRIDKHGQWYHSIGGDEFKGTTAETLKAHLLKVCEAMSPAEVEKNLKAKKDFDFKRLMAGAMGRDEYNKKWKIGKYAPPKNKLAGPGGVYKNLIVKLGEDGELVECKVPSWLDAAEKFAYRAGYAHADDSPEDWEFDSKSKQGKAFMAGRAAKKAESVDESVQEFFPAYEKAVKAKGWKKRVDHLHHPLHGTIEITRHGHWMHKPHGSTEPDDGFEGTTVDSLTRHLGRLTEATDPHYDKYWIKHQNSKVKGGFNYFGSYMTAADAKKDMEPGDELVYLDDDGKYHPVKV
jgi:hypothetical protein